MVYTFCGKVQIVECVRNLQNYSIIDNKQFRVWCRQWHTQNFSFFLWGLLKLTKF